MSQLNLIPTEIMQQTNPVGRWVIKTIHGVDTIYSTNLGSSLKFKLNHSSLLKINCFNNGNYLSNTQEIAVRIDTLDWNKFKVNHEINIPISDYSHTVEIMFAGNSDSDEVWTGKQGLAIKNIQVSTAAVISPFIQPHRITFIGDSITAGCWVNGKTASTDYAPHKNYVGICADILHCDATYIAYSAAGLATNGLGGVPTADQYLTKLDQETEFRLPTTELIVVNLGTNDTHVSVQEFKSKLIKFYHQLTSFAPNTPYLFIIPFNQSFSNIFHEVFHNKPVILVATDTWAIRYTDQVHPDLIGSKVAGEKLAHIIQTNFFDTNIL